MVRRVQQVPGLVPVHLSDVAVGLLRAEDRVFEAMLDGWRAQQLAHGLMTPSIRSACAVVMRLAGTQQRVSVDVGCASCR